MKKNNYVILFISILFISCKGFLDEVSQDQIRPNKADHFASLMLNECTLNHSHFPGASHMTDDISENSLMQTNKKKVYKTIYTWQNEIELDENGQRINTNVAWANLYRVIAILNDVLISIDDINDKQSEIAYVKGEAYFLRAYSYFDLVNLYALPYEPEKANIQLGVPIRLDHGVEQTYTRNSLKECYEQIERDLLTAKIEIAHSGLTKSLWHPTVEACDLLMSRIKLFKQEWESVIVYADSVTSKRGMMKLLDSMQFINSSNNEILYSYQYKQKDHNIEQMKNTGYVVSGDLLAIFDDANDIRFNCFLVRQDDNRRVNYYPRKFESYFTDFGIFNMRVAEAWLNKAEAFVHLENISSAQHAIKQVIDHRYRQPNKIQIPADPQKLLQFIYDERRREFCFEEHFRWYDLRRIGVEYRPEIKHIFTYVDENFTQEGQESYRFLKDDPNYVLPIPLAERDNNPLIINNDRMAKLPEAV
ncbi:MAG: RagB/SusD family nutrient uptake outer membrane protein [Odoribacter splanchnicus]